MIDSRVIQNLEILGQHYCDRYLGRWREIRDNWWTAFRDVILMNPELAIENASLVFPVDTWVSKIANKFGCESEDQDVVRSFFIKQMPARSAAKIAAGLWYLGFHSLEIVLANLAKIEITWSAERMTSPGGERQGIVGG
jgi:hypothetical protein